MIMTISVSKASPDSVSVRCYYSQPGVESREFVPSRRVSLAPGTATARAALRQALAVLLEQLGE